MNKILVIGNITKDLELKSTQAGKAVTTLSVAVNNGKDDTTFLDFGVFGAVAENCVKYLGKGSKVAVEGMIKNNNYTDKNGNNVYGFRFLANNVEFLNTKNEQKSSKEVAINPAKEDPYQDFANATTITDAELPF